MSGDSHRHETVTEGGAVIREVPFSLLHLLAVVVAEQVEQPVRQRRAPRLADDRGAEDDVAERARQAFRQLVAAVDREREHVGRLVDPEMLALQLAHLLRPDEREPELPVLDSLSPQHRTRELDGRALVDLDTAPVVDLDGQHPCRYLLRPVPVSSACSR